VSEMRCVICHKGPKEGVSVVRINAKGQSGLWACLKHRSHTDAPRDPVVADVLRALGAIQ
jgi:hypothetical protein